MGIKIYSTKMEFVYKNGKYNGKRRVECPLIDADDIVVYNSNRTKRYKCKSASEAESLILLLEMLDK